MPIKHAIWKVGKSPEPLKEISMASEQQLEDMIVARPGILSDDWMLIGRQEITGMGGRIDLLALAPDASVVLIELKRNQTPRDVIAQAIDYASWVEGLTAEMIAAIYRRFATGRNLKDDFRSRFGHELDEEILNESHQVVVVASSLDASTERIVRYLHDRDIAINVLFFQVFQSGVEQLLSRAWLMEPKEAPLENVATASKRADGRKKRQWDEATFFAELEGKRGAHVSGAARRLLEWSKVHVSRIWWGQGQHSGSFIPVFEQGTVKVLLFAVYTGGPQSKPTLQLYFAYWAKHPPFDSLDARVELLRRFNETPGIALPDTAVGKWPNIPLDAIANEASIEKIISVMEWFLSEIKRSADDSPKAS